MQKKKKHFRIATAIAEHAGWELSDVTEARYQPSRTPRPIFTLNDDYYTATSGEILSPSKEWPWEEVESWVTDAFGWRIWRVRC